MDLNICLYCEKHLFEENMTFCSLACQTNEASKPLYSNEFYPSRLISSRPATTSPSYEIAYHRRLSFSYSSYPSFYQQPLSSSSSSSTFSSRSSYSSSSSSLDVHPSNVKQNNSSSSSYLLTNSSILLEQDHHLLDLNKNHYQNVYTNYFFS